MADLNIAEIISLAEENRLDEAAKIINEYVGSFSQADLGACYVALASAYLKAEAGNQQKLSAILDSQLQQLKTIDREESKELEQAELGELRDKLS